MPLTRLTITKPAELDHVGKYLTPPVGMRAPFAIVSVRLSQCPGLTVIPDGFLRGCNTIRDIGMKDLTNLAKVGKRIRSLGLVRGFACSKLSHTPPQEPNTGKTVPKPLANRSFWYEKLPRNYPKKLLKRL